MTTKTTICGYVLYAPLLNDSDAGARVRAYDPATDVVAFEIVAWPHSFGRGGTAVDWMAPVYGRLVDKLDAARWGVGIYGAAMLRSLLS